MAKSLSKDHRKILEKTTADARQLAESACKAALENLAVHEKEYRSHMTVEQRELRNRLRARGKALGQPRDPRTGTQKIDHLIEVAGYEQWHRLLFTRFLTENNLLITDEANGSVPVTMEECEELAPELGARDGLDLACRFASRTLPGVFRRDDAVLELPLALNDQVELRKLLAALPSECFKADDALGWTYQFWQAQRKDEINDSGRKIGADELAPVTQLFTEDYMVEFLLHNTLGAWWAGKQGPISAGTEEEARARVALGATNGIPAITWNYLRFVQDEKTKTWSPAAGTFDGWPKTAREIKVLDPCMGSGHFLVFALPLLARLRMEEEGLSSQAAVVAVLKDNIHGLELDERCTQIAAFNLALTAWKLAGYQQLPALHLACSGLAPSATEAEWVALAGDNDRLRRGMARLHKLFKDAPVLGSLINPRAQVGDLIEGDYHELAPLLDAVLTTESSKTKHDDTAALAVVAQGMTKAAELLASQFTLVITNVPYLGRGKQDDVLKEYCERVHPDAKANLATCMLERALNFCAGKPGGIALVTPQNWLFLPGFKSLREQLLRRFTWCAVARLGAGAFETISGEVVNVVLLVLYNQAPSDRCSVLGLDTTLDSTASDKSSELETTTPVVVLQADQLSNPDARITLAKVASGDLLGMYATCLQGIMPADRPLFIRFFWEVDAKPTGRWQPLQSSSERTCNYGGLSGAFDLRSFELKFKEIGGRYQGTKNWGKLGIAIAQMSNLPVTLYLGNIYDGNIDVVVPNEIEDLPALWCFFSSGSFENEIRKLEQKLDINTGTILKVPFDRRYWQSEASHRYPNGLPAPHTTDCSQWLFGGHPKDSEQPLHVAVARLLGYRWPRQTGTTFPNCPSLTADGLERFADEDGIICLAPLNREQPGAARLRQLLTAALASFDERALIANAGPKGSKSKTLEEWLREPDVSAKMDQDYGTSNDQLLNEWSNCLVKPNHSVYQFRVKFGPCFNWRAIAALKHSANPTACAFW